MSREHEISVCTVFAKHLGLVFANARYPLMPWGEADDWARISDDTILVVEVETSQKPRTRMS